MKKIILLGAFSAILTGCGGDWETLERVYLMQRTPAQQAIVDEWAVQCKEKELDQGLVAGCTTLAEATYANYGDRVAYATYVRNGRVYKRTPCNVDGLTEREGLVCSGKVEKIVIKSEKLLDVRPQNRDNSSIETRYVN
ncbi:hypothetical protein VPFG_00229 [Vibrio phage nt-1]|uniref:Lipoprotein n=1 Tax=Vibrio phage nt-1 TaxID=115992 RepID=R9TGJ8_9CAUD|nr:hypothetical protein VPFG_00229 [Vibrio phage nt-1]AGN30228.1 hypothetical protein VPFG_00229 [Vibrio phage nt-1]